MPHSYLRIVGAGLLAGAMACGPVNSVRLRGGNPTGGLSPRTGTMPGELGGQPADPAARTPRTGDLSGTVGGSRHPGARQVCRASAQPRGWIAVAYVSSAGQCPVKSVSDSTATAAVLVRYADEGVGMELDVCADQIVPRGWVIARDEPADGDQCPGATREGPTTKRIRRVQ